MVASNGQDSSVKQESGHEDADGGQTTTSSETGTTPEDEARKKACEEAEKKDEKTQAVLICVSLASLIGSLCCMIVSVFGLFDLSIPIRVVGCAAGAILCGIGFMAMAALGQLESEMMMADEEFDF